VLVEALLRGIVGIEIVDVAFESKAKLSQNRSAVDRATAAAGLAEGTPREQALAEAMRALDE